MKRIALLLPALFFTAVSSGQVVLAGWEIEGVDVEADLTDPYTFTAGTVGTNIDNGALTLGSGVNPSTSSDQYGFKVSGGQEQASLAGAITNNHYIQFTITAASGFVFNLASIDIAGQSSGTGADNVALMTSVDGFTSGQEIASASSISGDTGGLDSDSSGFGALNFSGSTYENLSSITFRIYGWNTSGGNGVTYIRNLAGNDLVINGTTAAAAVPEPSTFGLIFGVATLGFCAFRRRTKQTS